RVIPRRPGRGGRPRLREARRPGPVPPHARPRPRPPDEGARPRHRLLRPRDELPDRGLRARLRLSRAACTRRRHEGQRPGQTPRRRDQVPQLPERLDPAPLPRAVDRDREAPLRHLARPAEGLLRHTFRPVPAQPTFVTVNANEAWPRFSWSSSASTWST